MRLASASLVLAVLCGLTACSGQGDEPQPSETRPAEPAGAAAPAQSAVPAAFMQCRSCHSVEPGKNLIGPSLAGVYGKKAAALPGFAYSKALRKSGLTWDDATLDAWLAGPTKLVPGTRMVIPVPDPTRRQEIIAYLKTLK